MSQSAIILGALLAGFVLYLAAKNRLSTYVGVLWGPTPDVPQPSQASQTSMSATTNSAGQVEGDASGEAALAAFAF
jgi:hypothetical protein